MKGIGKLLFRTQTVQLRYSKETKDLIATIALENSRGNSLDTDDVGIHSSEGGPTDLSYFTSLASCVIRGQQRRRRRRGRATSPNKCTGNPPVYTSDRNFPNDAVMSTTLEPTFVEEIGNTTVPAGRSIKLACSVKDLGTYKGKSEKFRINNDTESDTSNKIL
ncbi:hypothetical protein PV326_003859 [Microctonus aethiopoides]|nr:hypothetical protein PV326_003859 [Microctonus aethiopoides]